MECLLWIHQKTWLTYNESTQYIPFIDYDERPGLIIEIFCVHTIRFSYGKVRLSTWRRQNEQVGNKYLK